MSKSADLKQCKGAAPAITPSSEETGAYGLSPQVMAAIAAVLAVAVLAGIYYKRSTADKGKKRRVLSMAIVLVIAAASSLTFISMKPTGFIALGYDNLVRCLADKGAVLYGASWCGDCREQNALFGDDFSKLIYVDCKMSLDSCIADGIREIPAWKIDGKVYGYLSLEELASIAGC